MSSDKTLLIRVDGYNILPYLTNQVDERPRNSFFYVNDNGQATAIRVGDCRIVFMEQRAKTMRVWAEPFVELRFPKIFNLRRDPFERADENSNTYWDRVLDHVPAIYVAKALTNQQIQTFKEFPPRQKPGSFNLSNVMGKMNQATDGSLR